MALNGAYLSDRSERRPLNPGELTTCCRYLELPEELSSAHLVAHHSGQVLQRDGGRLAAFEGVFVGVDGPVFRVILALVVIIVVMVDVRDRRGRPPVETSCCSHSRLARLGS